MPSSLATRADVGYSRSQADIILGFLSSSLDQEDPKVAATAVVGIAKLTLSGMVTDEEVSCLPLFRFTLIANTRRPSHRS